MRVVAIVIGVGWIVFWIYWLVAATGAKRGQTRWGPCAGVRIAAILVVLILLRAHSFRNATSTADPRLGAVGLVAFASGLLLAVWARVHLGRNWGMPMSKKSDVELVTTGPYRSIRHPIYSGLILAMVGTAVAVNPYLLVVAAVLGGYFVYAAVMEERLMTERFPDTYPRYRTATKMLIPLVF